MRKLEIDLAELAFAFESSGERMTHYLDLETGQVIMIDGEMMVDLWAGCADKARSRPWGRDTIVNLYSTTKGMVSICVQHS